MNVMYIIGQNLILIAIAIRATQVWLHSPNSLKRIPDINIRVGFIMEPAAEGCAQTSMHCSTLLRPAGAREKDGEARTTQGLRAMRLPPA